MWGVEVEVGEVQWPEGKTEEKGWMCKWKILPEVFFMAFHYSKFISNLNSIAHVYSNGSTSTWRLKSTYPQC